MYGLKTTFLWYGKLYDDFRLADINNGDTLYTISIGDTRQVFNYNVYGRENDFHEPLYMTNHVSDLVIFLNMKLEKINEEV